MILEVKNLKVYFPVYGGKFFQKQVGDIKAVDDVTIDVKKGEILGVAGESGCGKTTLARAILRLVPKTSGKIYFEGRDLENLSPKEEKELTRKIQVVFQDPFLSVNSRMRIRDVIAEGIDVHHLVTGQKEREREVARLMEIVGLDPESMYRFPIEFSAGQRQRISIARALALNPDFLICDEPVSALDVSVQDQILKLLLGLREKFNLTYLFITHDLAVVRMISNRVAIMYLGKVVEYARKEALYGNPLHPYTRALFSSIPIPDPQIARSRKRIELAGEVPSAENIPSGCRFHTRCVLADQKCKEIEPGLVDKGDGHLVACHKAGGIA